MNLAKNQTRIGFIIGSPRSGTTLLGNILDLHDSIAEWYEPYYMWSFYVTRQKDDVWTLQDLKPGAVAKIRNEYSVYKQKANKPCIIEKTPGHAFHILPIFEIFPDAKFIHLLRDGRDTVLSIKREWQKRAAMVHHNDFRALLNTAQGMLKRQPYLKYRLMALMHEILTHRSLHPKKYLNKAKWQGKPYWGPRFYGWESYLLSHSHLEFNAMQWVKSVEAAQNGLKLLPASAYMEIRYEDLLADPEKILVSVLNFLGYAPDPEFFKKIPPLKDGNTRKWNAQLTRAEIDTIKPVLTPMLVKTGYLPDSPW
jgi:LPS sulfotransferase NodH